MNGSFKAFWVTEDNGRFQRQVITRNLQDLPDHEVFIRVHWSALNFKDALSASGHKGITRQFPHTPGIDASGVVVSDKTGAFSPGQEVIVTSYDLGMNTPGGFAEYIAVPAAWVVPLPGSLSLKEAMVLGTAGFTAALALYKMEKMDQAPAMGPILVTGSTGGVGSMAVALLHKAGYEVVASTGKTSEHEYLRQLGASQVIGREELQDQSDKPFLKTRWAGAIDTVGGTTLSTVLKSCAQNGNVAACGLVESAAFSTTVYPFIIKGNNLLGIESATCSMEVRQKIWNRLATEWKLDLSVIRQEEIDLSQLSHFIDQILQGKVKGRIIVNLQNDHQSF